MIRYSLILVCLLVSGCVSKRVMKLENELLQMQVDDLTKEVQELREYGMTESDYVRSVTLETVHEFLNVAGYPHTYTENSSHILMDYMGTNADFSISFQVFDGANVLFIATGRYFNLRESAGTESVVLLLTQLATFNYETLLGKFQLNPETGEILLSAELHLQGGLSQETFESVLDKLCQTADERYPDIELAAAGIGL
ncbi:MAG: hypothetical protein HN348_00445 [Proteobacteria bacterium]|jgi:hypothetical protein|nr:hypothetical protein [Pseudomonadota bacterium]